jgi:CheY-like chemotaxis protein
MKNADFVLIVEDDKEWRDIIKSLIKKNFTLNCRTTNNYQSSIKLLKSTNPLALILDLNLDNNRFNESQWSGWQLAELAREKHIPIIIVTGYPRDDRIARAFKSFKVIDFFDKKNFANRAPDFIKDVEGIFRKATKLKANIAKGREIQKNDHKQKTISIVKTDGKIKPKNVFISYSHQDRKWLDKFTPHLKVLADNNQLTIWDDTKIKSGAKWRDEIQKALSTAKVALLLVTPDFLASDFIMNVELPELYKAVEKREMTILWVAIIPSMYEETYISEFQSANDPNNPLANLKPPKVQQEIVQICKKVLQALR